MNPANDHVVVYRAKDGWRWHRVDNANGKVVSESGEAYIARDDAHEAALTLNRGVPVEIED